MAHNEIMVFQRSIEACADPAEIARKVKLAFKKMPGEMALACFAKAITAELPQPAKVAVWDAVRYSHIWWGVDEVLQGAVMENPTVQQAFADAVPMRKWLVIQKCEGWEYLSMTSLSTYPMYAELHGLTTENPGDRLHCLILLITHVEDVQAGKIIRENFSAEEDIAKIVAYRDWRGNNLLWYLTYRDDQNARGGFACPCIERELLRIGVDPNRRNNLGLSWNDVKRHVIRQDSDLGT